MNFVQISGHLGADAEERFTTGGKRVVSLRVATNIREGGKDEVIWWQVNIWDNRFDNMLPYLKKGSAVVVLGELMKPRVYPDKEVKGEMRVGLTIRADVVRFPRLGGGRKDGKEGEREGRQGDGEREEKRQPQSSGREEVGVGAMDDSGFTGDDLPF